MLSLSEVAIFADDLTGACDAAASFCPCAGGVRVLGFDRGGTGAGLVVVNAQSRHLSATVCRASLSRAGRAARRKRAIYFKVDAALRGPVGAAVEGLSGGAACRRVFVAPALPAIGRTTRGGIQLDRGVPIDRTEYAGDPRSPVRSAVVSEALSRTTRLRWPVCDAEGERDLDAVVCRALRFPKVILVGSLGLADALARVVGTDPRRPAPRLSARAPLIVCGSRYEKAQRQIERACAVHRARLVEYDPASGRMVPAVKVPAPGVLVVRIRPGAALSARQEADRLLDRFVGAAARLVRRARPDGLGIIGGDTAYKFLNLLQAEALEVHGRIGPVVPVGTVVGGLLHGRPLATKGGSVGDEDAVARMIEALAEGEARNP